MKHQYQYNFRRHMSELRDNESKKCIVENCQDQIGTIPSTFEETECYKTYVSKVINFTKSYQFIVPKNLKTSFDWTLLFSLLFSSTEKRPKIIPSSEDENKNDIMINEKLGDKTITEKLSELKSEDVVKLFEKLVEYHLTSQYKIDKKEDKYEEIVEDRANLIKTISFKLPGSYYSTNSIMYDFHKHMEKLRHHKEEGKRVIIEKYENAYGSMPFSFEETICYKKYLIKYLPYVKKLSINVPDDLKNYFDWQLLFILIISSHSSLYRIKRPNKIIFDKKEKPELEISVLGKNRISQKLSELWSIQISRLFEIYVEEQLNLQLLIETDEKKDLLEERSKRLDWIKEVIDSKHEELIDYAERVDYKYQYLYHYTDFRSFSNIIKSNSFRAFDIDQKNPQNYTIWEELFNQVYDTLCTKDDFENYIDILKDIKRRVTKYTNYRTFTTLFSLNRDLHGQWRKFGDYGEGICLVFRRQELQNLFYEKNCNKDLEYNLLYGNLGINYVKKYEYVYDNIIKILDNYKKCKKRFDDYLKIESKRKFLEKECLNINLNIGTLISLDALLFDCYVRYIYVDPRDKIQKEIKKDKDNNLEYIELEVGVQKLPIKEIIIGPKFSNKENAIESIKQLLKENGYEIDQIEFSISEVSPIFLN